MVIFLYIEFEFTWFNLGLVEFNDRTKNRPVHMILSSFKIIR